MGMRSEDGRGFARVGDQVSCPRCGSNRIATGDPTFILDGRLAAREGDKTECGATLIASQHVTTVSNEAEQTTREQRNDMHQGYLNWILLKFSHVFFTLHHPL
jgi:hypothetical protein